MDIDGTIDGLDATQARAVLKTLLAAYCTPAFGALPKREIDVLMFDLLHETGLIPPGASIYDLMRDLRITRPKARTLLYDREVRLAPRGGGDLDARVRRLLGQARFQKDGTYFVVEVENPLVQAHMRERVRELNYLTDTSFNAQLVRLPLGAVADLAGVLLSEAEQETVRKALIKAGAPDTGFRALLLGVLTRLGEEVAKEAGGRAVEAAVTEAGAYLEPLFAASGSAIAQVWKNLLTVSTRSAAR